MSPLRKSMPRMGSDQLLAHFRAMSARVELMRAALTWAEHPTANNVRALHYAASDFYTAQQATKTASTGAVVAQDVPQNTDRYLPPDASNAPHDPNFWPDSFTLVTASSHHGITSNDPPPPLEPEVAEGFASMLEQVQAMRAHYPPTENGE